MDSDERIHPESLVGRQLYGADTSLADEVRGMQALPDTMQRAIEDAYTKGNGLPDRTWADGKSITVQFGSILPARGRFERKGGGLVLTIESRWWRGRDTQALGAIGTLYAANEGLTLYRAASQKQ